VVNRKAKSFPQTYHNYNIFYHFCTTTIKTYLL